MLTRMLFPPPYDEKAFIRGNSGGIFASGFPSHKAQGIFLERAFGLRVASASDSGKNEMGRGASGLWGPNPRTNTTVYT